ncbi:MAG: peptide ABC transporter ATP-binding protein [Chloroflexi bacterium]|nr:MAG: peptide ABC transporter ATP-binding protein [Chloroflexota bacterium]
MTTLLEIKNLSTYFHTHEGVVRAVNDISYTVEAGEILGIVGESGSGKSVSMLSMMRLIPDPPGKIEKGEVIFAGKDLLKLSEEEMERVRGGEIAMIFQDPMTSLNPVLTIGFQIKEAIKLHQGMDETQASQRAIQLLEMVGIPNAADRIKDYPHQFSGGMRQRVMIAMGLSCTPDLLIADEPTTALDVTIQAQIVDLIKDLQKKLEMTVIWITHDLGVVARIAQRVLVMYAGRVIEDAPVKELFANPKHPYTLGLLRSLPRLDEDEDTELLSIPGAPPNLVNLPPGCPFAPRCEYVSEHCLQENPELEKVGDRHQVACWEKENTRSVPHVR